MEDESRVCARKCVGVELRTAHTTEVIFQARPTKVSNSTSEGTVHDCVMLAVPSTQQSALNPGLLT